MNAVAIASVVALSALMDLATVHWSIELIFAAAAGLSIASAVNQRTQADERRPWQTNKR